MTPNAPIHGRQTVQADPLPAVVPVASLALYWSSQPLSRICLGVSSACNAETADGNTGSVAASDEARPGAAVTVDVGGRSQP